MTTLATCTAICVAVSTGAAVGGLSLLGFGAAGVAASSLASWYQSVMLGGVIAAGGLFAAFQSLGATGITLKGYASLSAACAALCSNASAFNY